MPESVEKMRIAVIGAGISGMVSAWLLARRHNVTLFEAAGYAGGHTNTVNIESPDGVALAVDTGFIVYNKRNYPNFSRMLELLEVKSRPTTMGFSVKCQRTGLEYGGSSLNALFAQRMNLARPSFHRMLRDVFRFNRLAPNFLRSCDELTTLGSYFDQQGFSSEFINFYALPMGAALWSASTESMLDFPASTFIRFFENHGLLSLRGRPQWRTIAGGSQRYVEKLMDDFNGQLRLNSPVGSIRRLENGVEVTESGGSAERFDRVVIAVHSDQALGMLADPSPLEQQILGSIPYQQNTVMLHTDSSVLPHSKRAWASWNYHILNQEQKRVAVTYNMNILQGMKSKEDFLVTLNVPDAIDPAKTICTITYDHPVFNVESVSAQRRRDEISGRRNTYFVGAYWGYGFHEDGVNSALEVCRQFGIEL